MIRRTAALAIGLLLPAFASAAVLGGAPEPMETLHPAAVLHLAKTADWVLPTADAVWVGSTGPFAVHRIDPVTNAEVATVEVPGEPCAGLAAGFGSIWVPLCGAPNALARIDATTNRLAAVYPVGPAGAEGGVATDGRNVWMVVDSKGDLARIDPGTGHVVQTIALPAGSYNPLHRDGVIWVTGHDAGVVTAVDAATGTILASIPVGAGPRFLTAGAGSIWVILQGTGEIVRIDAARRLVSARIPAGIPGPGGDIAFGGGKVWPTMMDKPLMEIDAGTNQIERRWVGPGGDSLAYAFGAVWLTNYKAGTLSRYPTDVLVTP